MAGPLSPISTNVAYKHKSTVKVKEPAANRGVTATQKVVAKKAERDKNHAAPPPQHLLQPPGPDGIPEQKYTTGRLLGKGGFAICYEGQLVGPGYDETAPKFALKIVKAEMKAKNIVEKFCTELMIHSKLRHPNIVEFHRAFTFCENTYLVLELCTNGSIMDMMKTRGVLSLPEIRRYMVQLCGAVKYMHSRNIIHRDLKMGNLFLDNGMNIKLGDFGLAAVMMNDSEEKAARRTTMCGTPNYIAPEILNKGKQGHDHRVDIWAIGVILYAVLSGFPPFQSTSPEEIYKNVKSVFYTWPEKEKCRNDIPTEAKELVALILKTNAEERPSLDDIVMQPFFFMHGGNAIPRSIRPKCRTHKPAWLEDQEPRGDVMSDTAIRVSRATLAFECGVGYRHGTTSANTPIGEKADKSMFKEMDSELKQQRQPVVPMPKDVVYSSYPVSSLFPPAQARFTSMPEPCLASSLSEATVRSVRTHASSIRAGQAPNRAMTVGRAAGTANAAPPGIGIVDGLQGPRSMMQNVLSVRPSHASSESSKSKTMPRNIARLTRSRNVQSQEVNDGRAFSKVTASEKETAASRESTLTTGLLKSQAVRSSSRVNPTMVKPMESKMSQPLPPHQTATVTTEIKIANTIRREMKQAGQNQRVLHGKGDKVDDRSRTKQQTSTAETFLIGPDEVAECVPGTQPDKVLKRLETMETNLQNAIELSSLENRGKPITSELLVEDFKPDPVVVKWVDYTNKFGIGYILANGTVGCVFISRSGRPSSCVVVPNAESHLRKSKFTSYVDRHQMVPKQGAAIQFYEHVGNEGIRRVFARPSDFQVEVSDDGVPQKLGPGRDTYDHEKRRMFVLHNKFAKYMTGLGKREDPDKNPKNHDLELQDVESLDADSPNIGASNIFVKFYQRLGNLGIWGFGGGSFQFNFPDHTKLVITGDGKFADFYHLPIKAARELAKGKELNPQFLDDRSVISGPMTCLLRGEYDGRKFTNIMTANQFAQKVIFAKSIIMQWIKCGGLGKMDQNHRRMTWTGMTETVSGQEHKLVWVTCGARGGDTREDMTVPGDAEDHIKKQQKYEEKKKERIEKEKAYHEIIGDK